MKKINNKKDLYSEKQRLQMELSKAEDVLKSDMEWLNEELMPLRKTGELIKKVFYTKGGMVNEGFHLAVSTLLKNTVLSKAGWVTRLVVPLIIKGFASGVIQEKKPDIFNLLRNIIHKARKKPSQNGTHYDKSTVEDVDY